MPIEKKERKLQRQQKKEKRGWESVEWAPQTAEKRGEAHQSTRAERGKAVNTRDGLKSRERQGCRRCVPRDMLDQREARLQGMRTSQHFNTSLTYLIQHLIHYLINTVQTILMRWPMHFDKILCTHAQSERSSGSPQMRPCTTLVIIIVAYNNIIVIGLVIGHIPLQWNLQ